jgi:hypothetical protein
MKFYGLVKDIDFNEGLKIIPQFGMDIVDADFNAVCLVYDAIFRFPSSYLIQGDVEEMMLREGTQ